MKQSWIRLYIRLQQQRWQCSISECSVNYNNNSMTIIEKLNKVEEIWHRWYLVALKQVLSITQNYCTSAPRVCSCPPAAVCCRLHHCGCSSLGGGGVPLPIIRLLTNSPFQSLEQPGCSCLWKSASSSLVSPVYFSQSSGENKWNQTVPWPATRCWILTCWGWFLTLTRNHTRIKHDWQVTWITRIC